MKSNSKLFLSLLFLIFSSCSLFKEDPLLICSKTDDHCTFSQIAPGLIDIENGTRHKYRILTQDGMKKIGTGNGVPAAYNPKTETVIFKEMTDKAIKISVFDLAKEKEISSFSLPIKEYDQEEISYCEEDEEFAYLAEPQIKSACISDDGTSYFLVRYSQPFPDSGIHGRMAAMCRLSYDLIYVLDKSESEPKTYVYPNKSGETSKVLQDPGVIDTMPYEETPVAIQCSGDSVYVLETMNWIEYSWAMGFEREIPGYIRDTALSSLNELRIDAESGQPNITGKILLAKDHVNYSFYSKERNALYAAMQESGLYLFSEFDTPLQVPSVRGEGDYLFSETADGRTLVFFVPQQKEKEDLKLELISQ